MRGDPGTRGAQWKENAHLNRPTKYLFLSDRVAECAGQCRDSQIFRLLVPRNDERHRSTTPPRGISYVSALCLRWTHPTRKCRWGSRERKSVTKQRIWLSEGTKVLGRQHPGEVARGIDQSCSTRGTQSHARFARLGCGPCL